MLSLYWRYMMEKLGCEKCRDLCRVVEIRSLGDLREAFRVAKDNIEDGTIVESRHRPEGRDRAEAESLLALSDDGPWGDYLEFYFECSQCRQAFRLAAETYHGAGGQWKPIDADKERPT
jgi:hypothetical protein